MPLTAHRCRLVVREPDSELTAVVVPGHPRFLTSTSAFDEVPDARRVQPHAPGRILCIACGDSQAPLEAQHPAAPSATTRRVSPFPYLTHHFPCLGKVALWTAPSSDRIASGNRPLSPFRHTAAPFRTPRVMLPTADVMTLSGLKSRSRTTGPSWCRWCSAEASCTHQLSRARLGQRLALASNSRVRESTCPS